MANAGTAFKAKHVCQTSVGVLISNISNPCLESHFEALMRLPLSTCTSRHSPASYLTTPHSADLHAILAALQEVGRVLGLNWASPTCHAITHLTKDLCHGNDGAYTSSFLPSFLQLLCSSVGAFTH